jgi:hypothetical protein
MSMETTYDWQIVFLPIDLMASYTILIIFGVVAILVIDLRVRKTALNSLEIRWTYGLAP